MDKEEEIKKGRGKGVRAKEDEEAGVPYLYECRVL